MGKRFFVFAVTFALLVSAFSACALGEGAVQVGDTVTFGSYEQDNDLSNGAEPIEWTVLAVDGNIAQLWSVYALDVKPWNETPGKAQWTKCTLRTWLNSEFYNTAFSDEEKAAIVTKEIENWREDSTSDPVYLLSVDEAKHLFDSFEARQTKPTAYALAKGIFMSGKYEGYTMCWLRTHSWEAYNRAGYIAASGGVVWCGGETNGRIENGKWGVCPAVYVDTSLLK